MYSVEPTDIAYLLCQVLLERRVLIAEATHYHTIDE